MQQITTTIQAQDIVVIPRMYDSCEISKIILYNPLNNGYRPTVLG
jgi:hypothetical protein